MKETETIISNVQRTVPSALKLHFVFTHDTFTSSQIQGPIYLTYLGISSLYEGNKYTYLRVQ